MKTILIATDFSNASHNASLYGVSLATSFNARLILFNAYQPAPLIQSQSEPFITTQSLASVTSKRLANESKAINPMGTIEISGEYKAGPAVKSILEAAGECKADLIIVGIKHPDKILQKIFGDTVTSLIRKSTIPLLAIPEDIEFKPAKSIAVAIEKDLPDEINNHFLDVLKEVGERFQSKVFAVRVVNNDFQEAWWAINRPAKFLKMLRTLTPVFECIKADSVVHGLQRFVKGNNIDLLVMFPYRYSAFEKMFVKKVTSPLIFHLNVPLLLIPEVGMNSDIQKAKRQNSNISW